MSPIPAQNGEKGGCQKFGALAWIEGIYRLVGELDGYTGTSGGRKCWSGGGKTYYVAAKLGPKGTRFFRSDGRGREERCDGKMRTLKQAQSL